MGTWSLNESQKFENIDRVSSNRSSGRIIIFPFCAARNNNDSTRKVSIVKTYTRLFALINVINFDNELFKHYNKSDFMHFLECMQYALLHALISTVKYASIFVSYQSKSCVRANDVSYPGSQFATISHVNLTLCVLHSVRRHNIKQSILLRILTVDI